MKIKNDHGRWVCPHCERHWSTEGILAKHIRIFHSRDKTILNET